MTGRADETGPLWGGRFEGSLDPTLLAYTGSLTFDRRLATDDVVGSLAHVRSLWEAGVLGAEVSRRLLRGLGELLDELEAGELVVEGDDEDVHSWLERTLGERLGGDAGWVHTGRSRNDQTATALRLHTRRSLAGTVAELEALIGALLGAAEPHLESWMPGYTHLQRGQPVSLAHHLLAHVFALLEDGRRLVRAHRTAGVSPLGAGALAGSPHPLDPARSASLLGFERSFDNSLHAVADRDYVAEVLFACGLLMLHLSRWAEEVVLWSSSEFGFLELEDAVAQGSSLMPQKRNPEAAEILRGKSGRVVGGLVSLLTTLKGLPLAYDSDLQEDKEPLFDGLDTATDSLRAARVLLGGLRFRTDRMREALAGGYLTATALADLLVREGVPFREAHRQVGAAVREAERRRVELWELPEDALTASCPGVDPTRAAALTPERVVRELDTPGGPAPGRVLEQLRTARRRLGELTAWREALRPPPVLRLWREGRLLETPAAGKTGRAEDVR